MKIVFTVASYYPQINGVQYVTQYQAEGLALKGHEVVVITSEHPDTSEEELYNGVKIIRINAHNKHLFHVGNRRQFTDTLLHELKNADVMINVCLQSYTADWVLPLLKDIKVKKILIMHGMHSFSWSQTNKNSIGEIGLKIIRDIRWFPLYHYYWKDICRYDIAIHLHELDYAYMYFQRRGFLNNKVLYNAVEDGFFEEASQSKENVIINVSTFHPNKNQIRAIRVFEAAHIDNWRLVLIGPKENDYYYKVLKARDKYNKKTGLNNIEIYCGITRLETIRWIKKSKIYLLTSNCERFPISIIEAMATGACFVSTDVGVVSSLPGGKVSHTDIEMIEQLNRVIDSEQGKLAKEARDYAMKNLRTSTQVGKLEAFIK